MDSLRVTLTVIMLLNINKIAQGINCYECDSITDKVCWSADLTRTEVRADECGPKDNVCVKMYTQVYKMTHSGLPQPFTNMTSRLCGYSWWTGCRHNKNPFGYTIHCACDQDGCNGAQRHLAGGLLLWLLLAVMAAKNFL